MPRKEKQPVHHVQMTEGKRNLIRALLQEYEIESAQDIQDALKDLLGSTIKEMMSPKWMNIWAIRNLRDQIATTTVMAIKPSKLTVVMAA